MRGGMSRAMRAGCARQLPALSARVPMVSYSTIRLRVWYLANAAAKHLTVNETVIARGRERESERVRKRQTHTERKIERETTT